MEEFNNTSGRAISLGFTALGMVISAPILALFFYYITPITHWVEYSNVLPEAETFSVGTYPRFKSVRHIQQAVKLEWRDIEFCDFGSGFGRRVSFKSESNILQPTDGFESTRPWSYGEEEDLPVVTMEATCYLESHIIKPAPFSFLRAFFDKEHVLTSDTYQYVYDVN